MRRTLLSLSIAAAISLPVLVQASVLSDKDGNQTVSGDQTYTQVKATNGNTLNFTDGSIKVDNSANTQVNAPQYLSPEAVRSISVRPNLNWAQFQFSQTRIKSNIQMIKEKLIKTILIGPLMSKKVY